MGTGTDRAWPARGGGQNENLTQAHTTRARAHAPPREDKEVDAGVIGPWPYGWRWLRELRQLDDEGQTDGERLKAELRVRVASS